MAEFSSLLELVTAIPDEQSAIDHFTAIRWKDGEFCPYCGSVKVYHFADNAPTNAAIAASGFRSRWGPFLKVPKSRSALGLWQSG